MLKLSWKQTYELHNEILGQSNEAKTKKRNIYTENQFAFGRVDYGGRLSTKKIDEGIYIRFLLI